MIARRVGDVGDHAADLLDVAEDADAVAGEQLLGDGAGGDAADRLAGARAAAAAIVAEAVLGVEGEVGVAGAVLVLDVAVVGAALIGVAEEMPMDVPSVLPSKTPDQISGSVVLVALRDELRLPRPAAAQIGQQIVDGQRQSGRAAVDDDKDTRARG